MAYNAAKHSVFVNRVKNFCTALQGIREESARLDAIYLNETASGTNEFFVDTHVATEAEIVNTITMMRDVKAFFENSAVSTQNRQVWLTPFLSND